MTLSFPIDDEVYQGPLHLLLALAERGEVDLSRLSLARLAERYLQEVRRLEPLPLDEVGEFLYMGARLVRLKLQEAAMGEVPEEIFDLQAELALLEALRKAAFWLKEREGGRTYARPAAPPPALGRKEDLVLALRRMGRRVEELADPEERTVRRRGVRLEDVMEDLRGRVTDDLSSFRPGDWPWGSRGVALFAALELARRQEITIDQERPFEEIFIRRGAAE